MINRKISLFFAFWVLVTLAACTQSDSTVGKLAQEKENFMLTQSNRPLVEITFTDKRPRRPPLVTLLFTITLRNESSQASWFLLPSQLNLPTAPLKNGVDGLTVLKFKGTGEVIIGRFQGTGEFQALRLPGKAEVILRDFPVAFWGQLPEKPIALEVIIANQLTVGGKPAQDWFEIDPTSDRQANVSLSQSERLSSTYTPDRQEVPVSVSAEKRLQLQVSVN